MPAGIVRKFHHLPSMKRVVLYTNYPSTTTDFNSRRYGLLVRVPMRSTGYKVCGYAAKDHYNQNDGEAKGASLRKCVGLVTTQPKISHIMAP